MVKREFHIENEYQYNQSTPVRWIVSHALRYKTYLLGFVFGTVLANVLRSYIPVLTGDAFNVVEASGEEVVAQLVSIALLLVGIVVLRMIGDIVGQFSMEFIAKRMERDARDELYLNLLGKSQTFHNRQRVGDIMARATNDVRQLNGMMMPGVALLFDSFMGTVSPIIFIALLDPQLLVAPLLFLVAFGFALNQYMNQLEPVSNRMRKSFGQMNAGLTEAITGIEVVKVAAQEVAEMAKFSLTAGAYRDNYVENGRVQARYVPPLLLSLAVTGAFLHGLWLLSRGVLSVGDLVAYMGLMILLRFPTFISIFTFSLVQLGRSSAGRILELMQEETEIDENAAGYGERMAGEVVFEGVTFGYEGKVVLREVSFRARPGQTIAIVGQTGSGKSTLTKLVNRTYDIESGRILIDGHDVRDWNLASLRSQVSTIEQDIFLFSRSLRDNIAFGLGQNSDEQAILHAAKEAQAHEFITGFKDGYDTEIGERGVTLSGGQRQRLAIARALLTDPRILILDDATSAVDSATEDKIQSAIYRVLEGRTTLLITHRLSQIKRADHILVLQQGRVIDQGTHDELVERCTLYRRIFLRHN